MATLQGKAVKNTYRQVLQIGANNVGVSATLQPVQDGAGVNTALSLSTIAATVNGDLTVTGDLIITGGGLQIKELIDDTVAALIKNGTGITWTYDDAANSLTGNFTGTTSVVPEGSNLYYTQGRFDSAFAAKTTTNLAEGTNLYFTTARGNANFATNLAASDTDDLAEGATNLYYTNSRARLALSVTAGTGISYDNTTGVFSLGSIPNASLTNSSVTVNSLALPLGGSITLTTTNIAEGTNLYWTNARFDSRFGTKTTTDLAEGTNLYYTQTRFNTAFSAKTTTDLAEGTNLYYTDARSRAAFSENAVGLDYSSGSGVLSLTSGYAIPTTVKLGEYDTAYNRSIVSAAVTGTGTKTLSLTQQDANVVTATWTDLGITTINGTANQIATNTVGNTTTVGFTNDVTFPNNVVVSGNLTINGTATYVNTESISSKDPLFEVANTNNTTDAVDIGYYGRYYDAIQERVEFTGLFRDASDAGKFKIFSGLVDEPTNVVNTTGTGYTVATLVANVDGNLAGTANAANVLSTARTISASGDATWSVSFDGSANATAALTLANTGVTATTYGTSTSVPTIAVDAKGRITSASNTNIAFPVTTVNGFSGTVVLTTSDVAEGSNQYFTTARAQAAITGGASSVVTANLTASRALVSDGSGKIAASATTTTTEIGYLAGVTSALQTQLDGKLNLTGGTLTGPLIGTTGSFSSSGSGDTFTIGHTSGSGIALNITKNGNGEGLYINKASGSGNAATFVGNLGGTTADFSGIVTTPQVKASTSAGLSINSNAGTQIANLGAGGGANMTLYGGLTGTSATFSGLVTANAGIFFNTSQATTPAISIGYNSVQGLFIHGKTASSYDLKFYNGGGITIMQNPTGTQNLEILGALSGTSATFSGEVSTTQGIYINRASLPYIQFAQSGTAFGQLRGNGTTFGLTDANGSTYYLGVNASTGAATFSSSVTAAGGLYLPSGGLGTSPNFSYLNSLTYGLNLTGGNAGIYFGNQYNSSFATAMQLRVVDGGGTNITAMTLISTGQVGINTDAFDFGEKLGIYSTTSYTLHSKRTGTGSEGHFAFSNGNGGVGSIFTSGLSTFYNTSSDYRLKQDFKDYNGLDLVSAIKTYDYKWKSDETRAFGVIAHELAEVLPYAVNGEKDGEMMQGVDYSKIVPILVKAIQELKAEIDELKAK